MSRRKAPYRNLKYISKELFSQYIPIISEKYCSKDFERSLLKKKKNLFREKKNLFKKKVRSKKSKFKNKKVVAHMNYYLRWRREVNDGRLFSRIYNGSSILYLKMQDKINPNKFIQNIYMPLI